MQENKLFSQNRGLRVLHVYKDSVAEKSSNILLSFNSNAYIKLKNYYIRYSSIPWFYNWSLNNAKLEFGFWKFRIVCLGCESQ